MTSLKPQASSLKPQASSLNLTIKEGLNKSKLSILEEEELLHAVIEGYLALLLQQILPIECPAKIKEFYLLLLRNLFNGYRISEAKAECGFQDQNFSRLFAKWVGMKPKEFCSEHTMAVGAFLLCETSCSIGEIALALGFQNQDAFGKAIKRKYGVGPVQLRLQSK
ncbi:MAG: helix-turn-helix transcriptional regulator [Bacteroidetes Order II. Incertae sedis bacterium]|nr:helix-turn-helix transcriptional regulator [Bacteroidetes Order II. bacterium]